MFKTLKQIDDNWNVFPNTKELGYYSFLTQSIHLSSVEGKDIQELIKILQGKLSVIDYKQYQILRKTLGVLHHEYTHWVDNTSTIWGTSILLKIFKAFQLRSDDLKGLDRSAEYYKIKELRDLTRRISYSDYYTTIYENVENQYPWIPSYSIGKLFAMSGKVSEYPIIFSRFTTPHDKKIICRVPFSLSSILESGAMSQEFYIDHSALNILDGDCKYVEMAKYKEEVKSTVYNHHLCVYNVAAHHVANCTKVSDISLAYRICCVLGRFVLNFPTSLFSTIQVPIKLVERITKGQNNELWQNGYETAFKHHDRAILFFLIASLLPIIEKNRELSDSQIVKIIVDILPLINLNYETIENDTIKEIESNFDEIGTYSDPMARYLAKAGRKIYNKIGVWGQYPYKFQKFSPIPAILGDDSLFQPYGEAEGLEFDFFDHIYRSMDLEPHIREFEEACVY